MIATEMLHVETCARQGGAFIPIDTLTMVRLEDPLYVDGSIRVTSWGKPLITDAEWTDIVHWWGGMSDVLRRLSSGTDSHVEEGFPDSPMTMSFEVDGGKLIWTVRGSETRSATLDCAAALRILMLEYRRFFERMQVISPRRNGDYDVALDYMKYFKEV